MRLSHSELEDLRMMASKLKFSVKKESEEYLHRLIEQKVFCYPMQEDSDPEDGESGDELEEETTWWDSTEDGKFIHEVVESDGQLFRPLCQPKLKKLFRGEGARPTVRMAVQMGKMRCPKCFGKTEAWRQGIIKKHDLVPCIPLSFFFISNHPTLPRPLRTGASAQGGVGWG